MLSRWLVVHEYPISYLCVIFPSTLVLLIPSVSVLMTPLASLSVPTANTFLGATSRSGFAWLAISCFECVYLLPPRPCSSLSVASHAITKACAYLLWKIYAMRAKGITMPILTLTPTPIWTLVISPFNICTRPATDSFVTAQSVLSLNSR
jgi:hypothetical protein